MSEITPLNPKSEDVAANEATHTPGPWLWGLDDVDAVWAPNGGEGNVICCPPPERAADSYARWPANAHLIAAAPDLLEACEAAEFILASLCVDRESHTRQQLRAALANARGQGR